MTYEQALSYIQALEPRGIRLGLERMRAFCQVAGLDSALGGPTRRFVHVAGTNGKGSTTAYLQSLMVEAGYRTGAFFSPYVVDPRERIQIGRELIPKGDLAALTEKLIPFAESFIEKEHEGITEFEFKTALGFAFWEDKGCDWVALEVGLGGQFDATNVVHPVASIIVSIGLDHVSILGDTLGKIAFEKAGIVKPGIPVIVGSLPPEATEVVEQIARERGAPLWRWGRDFAWEAGALRLRERTVEAVTPGIVGEMQGHNLALAVAAMIAAGADLSDEVIRRGASHAFAPGRFQQVKALGTTFLLDGAHNVDSARILRRSIERQYPGQRWVALTNMVQGHEPHELYGEIIPLFQSAHVAPIDFHRAYPVETVASVLRGAGVRTSEHEGIASALLAAASEAGPDGGVLVTGSFYLVGQALRGLRDLDVSSMKLGNEAGAHRQ